MENSGPPEPGLQTAITFSLVFPIRPSKGTRRRVGSSVSAEKPASSSVSMIQSQAAISPAVPVMRTPMVSQRYSVSCRICSARRSQGVPLSAGGAPRPAQRRADRIPARTTVFLINRLGGRMGTLLRSCDGGHSGGLSLRSVYRRRSREATVFSGAGTVFPVVTGSKKQASAQSDCADAPGCRKSRA